MTTQRQSNIELCRLASILLVMIVHTTKQSLGNGMNFYVCLLEGFSFIGVNVFILITGYFSTIPKKSSLVNLAFICLFWMIIKVMVKCYFGKHVEWTDYFFVTSSNWFIPSYIGLVFVSPILNSFCNSASKNVLWGVVVALLFIEFWFDLLPPSPIITLGSQKGYSIFSFCILYMFARAIRLHGLPDIFMRLCPYIYIVISIVLGITAYSCQSTGQYLIENIVFAYNNPLVILSSVAFLMAFVKMKFQSALVNHISKSTLACLLGHTSIFFLYSKNFKYLYDNFTGLQVVVYWVLSIFIVFCLSIAIDQLRLLLYRPIDKIMKSNIKNNNIFEIPTDHPFSIANNRK